MTDSQDLPGASQPGAPPPSNPRSLLVLRVADLLLGVAWLHLLYESWGGPLLLPLLALGCAQAPLHLLRLSGQPGRLPWASVVLELLAIVYFRVDTPTAILLGSLNALAVYAWWQPRAEEGAPARGWLWVQRAGLLFAIAVGWARAPNLLSLFAVFLIAAEARFSPPPERNTALARVSGLLGVVASWSLLDSYVYLGPLVCCLVLDRVWTKWQKLGPRKDDSLHSTLRLLAVGFCLYPMGPPIISLAGFGLCVSGLLLAKRPTWSPVIPIVGVVGSLWLLELAAGGLGFPTGAPPQGGSSFSPRAQESGARYWKEHDYSLSAVDSQTQTVTIHGQAYRVHPRGYREPLAREGAARIILVGDEAVFGVGLSAEETLGVRLQERLRARGVSGPVHSYGILAGTSADAHWLLVGIYAQQPQAQIVWIVRDDDLLSRRHDQVYQADTRGSLPVGGHLLAPLLRTRLGGMVSAPYDAALRGLGWRDDYYTNVLEEHSAESYRFGNEVWWLARRRTEVGLRAPWILVLPNGGPRRAEVQAHLEMLAEVAKAEVISAEPIRRAGPSAWLPWEPDIPSAKGQEIIADTIMAALELELSRGREPGD